MELDHTSEKRVRGKSWPSIPFSEVRWCMIFVGFVFGGHMEDYGLKAHIKVQS